jgi:hypothetical protein
VARFKQCKQCGHNMLLAFAILKSFAKIIGST